VLALTCHIELFTQAHYRSSIEPAQAIDPLWKDVFLFHWKEESQHAILDELEWVREDGKLSARERDKAVDDLIGLVGAVDGILQAQARSDADCFTGALLRDLTGDEKSAVHATMLAAYRHQYIATGVKDERFLKILGGMVTKAQMQRIGEALAPILG